MSVVLEVAATVHNGRLSRGRMAFCIWNLVGPQFKVKFIFYKTFLLCPKLFWCLTRLMTEDISPTNARLITRDIQSMLGSLTTDIYSPGPGTPCSLQCKTNTGWFEYIFILIELTDKVFMLSVPHRLLIVYIVYSITILLG